MRTLYFILLVLTGIGTVIALIPNVALVASLYTYGLAAPLFMLVPNIFVLLLCLLPLMLGLVSLRAGLVLGTLAIAGVSFGPGLVSEQVAQSLTKNQTAQDTQAPQAISDRKLTGVEFQRPAEQNPNLRGNRFESGICGTFCRQILHGGQVDWVRMHFTDQPAGTNKITLIRGQSPDCAQTLCFEFAENSYAPADIVLRYEEDYKGPYDANRNPKGFAQYQGHRRLIAKAGDTLLARQTEVHLFVINGPTGLTPAFHGLVSGGNAGGLRFIRSREQRNTLDPQRFARDLGLTLAAVPAPPAKSANRRSFKASKPTASDRAKVASLIAHSGDINQSLEREINQWLMGIRRQKTLEQADVDLLMRIAEDERFRFPPALPKMMLHFPEVRAQTIPWLFDRLEQKDLAKGPLLERLSGDLRYYRNAAPEYAPFADRFVALVKERRYHTPLLGSAGLFGFDPEPMLRAAYVPGDKSHYEVMRGVCFSETKWFDGLVPLVRDIVTQEIALKPGIRVGGVIEDGLRFLTYTGHADEARALVKGSKWDNKERLLTRGFLSPDAPAIRPDRIC